jgi:hypothetical protein
MRTRHAAVSYPEIRCVLVCARGQDSRGFIHGKLWIEPPGSSSGQPLGVCDEAAM